LIDKSRNWKPKTEDIEKSSSVKFIDLNSGSYDPNKKSISFNNGSSKGDISLQAFIEGILGKEEIKLTDPKGNIIKIENTPDKVKLEKDDKKEELKVEIDNGSGKKIIFGIPLNEITDKLATELGYENAKDLMAKLLSKK
jgi:hypothetical protein